MRNPNEMNAGTNNRYKVGDQVLWLKSVNKRKKGKFVHKWFGPYEIIKVYKNRSVDLLEVNGLPIRVNIHKVRHYNNMSDDSISEPVISVIQVQKTIPKQPNTTSLNYAQQNSGGINSKNPENFTPTKSECKFYTITSERPKCPSTNSGTKPKQILIQMLEEIFGSTCENYTVDQQVMWLNHQ